MLGDSGAYDWAISTAISRLRVPLAYRTLDHPCVAHKYSPYNPIDPTKPHKTLQVGRIIAPPDFSGSVGIHPEQPGGGISMSFFRDGSKRLSCRVFGKILFFGEGN